MLFGRYYYYHIWKWFTKERECESWDLGIKWCWITQIGDSILPCERNAAIQVVISKVHAQKGFNESWLRAWASKVNQLWTLYRTSSSPICASIKLIYASIIHLFNEENNNFYLRELLFWKLNNYVNSLEHCLENSKNFKCLYFYYYCNISRCTFGGGWCEVSKEFISVIATTVNSGQVL